MRVDAVVYDLDNTLVDFHTMKRQSVDAALDKMIERGLPVNKSEAWCIVDEVYRNHGWEDPLLFWHVAEYAGIRKEVQLERFAQMGKTAYRRRQRDFLHPYEGVVETLDGLKELNVRLAILSDAPRLKIFDRLCDTGLEPYFEDSVVGGDDGGHLQKPSAEAFQRVLSVLERDSPQGVLMVGDHPVRDILGAKNYGFGTAWAKYGFVPKLQQDVIPLTRADYTLETPTDVLEIVRGSC
ncbi:HAD-IA family hydrolase [Candidatus Woesearchaeota archaeon]|nr:HAD-IA family hydrolase [Candidatus Woesearchaeota archaeon]